MAAGLTPCLSRPNYKSPNEKLDIAGVGANGRAAADLEAVSSENIVALCDVDANSLAAALKKYPGARPYTDYRVMLEKEKTIDAVTVATPDHHHAPAAIRAIRAGKHVYVEKPLTHTVWEARQLTLAARQYGVATQMGNQGHCGDGIRELCEMIWAGAIGPGARSPLLDRPRQRLVDARPPSPPRLRSRPVLPGLGQVARPGARCGPYLHEWPKNLQTSPTAKMFIIPPTGAAGGILAAAPWATWPATSWIARKWP